MTLVDAHCHLDFEAFDADRDEVLDRAAALGVRAIVIPGVHSAQWARAAALVRRGHPRVRLAMAVGWHPEHLEALVHHTRGDESDDVRDAASGGSAARDREPLVTQIVRAASELGAVAIGECGLDRRVEARVSLERQREVLDAHVEAAKRSGLPLVLHVVRRDGALLDALRPHAPLRGMVHAFTGGPELAREYVALGLHVSFGGGLTRPNARRARDAAAVVPAERVLIETDAPDQTPHGAPSPRNEPSFLPLVRDALARPEIDVAGNAIALFGI
ncbi:MAG: TatD family hydrolase [Myxococcota bacterium]|jgi:TatD DNase family protein|nr:TatD family hydrolase [Myxococcota bacterium]